MSTYQLPGTTLKQGDGTDIVGTSTTTTPYIDLVDYLSRYTQSTAALDRTYGHKWYIRPGLSITGWKLRIPAASTLIVKLWANGVQSRTDTVAYGSSGVFTGTFSGGAVTAAAGVTYALTIYHSTDNFYYYLDTDTSASPWVISGAGQGRQMTAAGITFLGNAFAAGNANPSSQNNDFVFHALIPTFSVTLAP